MAHAPNLFPLKLLVISLGFVLIGGTIFLFAAIAGKAGKEIAATHCKDAAVNLKGAGNIVSILPAEKTIDITLAQSVAPGKETGLLKVLTFDRCNGTLIRTLTITP